jgi:hypothetical protein
MSYTASAKDEDVPEAAKLHIRKQLLAWIDELRRTRQAFFFRVPTDSLEYFDDEMAKRV